MTLIAEDWAVLWAEHWPLNVCPDTSEVHFMQHTGMIFQCENCHRWFAAEESEAFFAAAFRIKQLTTDKHHIN